MTVLALSAAMLLLSQGASFTVLATLDGSDLESEAIDAQAIGLPHAVAADQFAEQVVQAEHLTSWNNGPMSNNRVGEPLGYKAVSAGDGRGVIVYYSPQVDGPRVVCRIRTNGQKGLSRARYRALRWCAEQVGVEVPLEPTAPIVRRKREP